MEYQNKISLQWDNVYNRFRGKRLSVWRETATPFFVNKIEYLKYKKVKNILDAGCGDGRNLSAFAQEGFDVMGFDVSSLAIKKCNRLFLWARKEKRLYPFRIYISLRSALWTRQTNRQKFFHTT